MSGSRGLIKTAGVIVARGLIDVADRELVDFNKTKREREGERGRCGHLSRSAPVPAWS